MANVEPAPTGELNTRPLVKIVVIGALLIAAAFTFDRLTDGNADCVVKSKDSFDVNVLQCANDILGTELG